MAIVQISKLQQRSGNLVDLPQLDEAELGFATDAKRLFVGKESPAENIEVLTSYSNISFSQIDGAVGNLNINSSSIANGQVLTYTGSEWTNRGGSAGGLITLGDVSNVSIEGGAIGYVLETDGTGNLSWTPKSSIIAYIANVTKANPAVVTTTEDNYFISGAEILITDVEGMTELNGNTYYANVITSNTFSLYSDSALTTPVDSTLYTTYTGNGRVISQITGGSGSSIGAGGSPTQVQFNSGGLLAGSSSLTWSGTVLTVVSNISVGNITATSSISGSTLTSTIATGTAPLTVSSTTRVNNLNVSHANVSDFGNVSLQTTGTFFPTFVSASATGNRALGANANLSFNVATGNLVATILTATGNVSGGNLTTTGVVTATGNVSGGNIVTVNTVSGSLLTGTLTTAAQPNVTSVSTSFTSLTFANAQSITGNNLSLTTGANTNPGTITGNWTLTSGSRLQATYADLAEYYSADKNYESGTVLEFGGLKEVTIAEDGSNRIAGVVSTDPAYAMNAKCPGIAVAIALQGRVPCKVKGKIRKGDMLISAGNGFARPSINPNIGTVIGKSLEDFDGPEGVIEVAVGRL